MQKGLTDRPREREKLRGERRDKKGEGDVARWWVYVGQEGGGEAEGRKKRARRGVYPVFEPKVLRAS